MNKININANEKEELVFQINEFLNDELDVEVGSLGADSLLDFFLQKAGAKIYNQGVKDTQEWFAASFQELNLDSDSLLKES